MDTMTVMAVSDSSQVGEVRRKVLGTIGAFDWTESDAGTAALLVTEACTNLVRHAGGGTVLYRVDGGEHGLELLALDTGPGLEAPLAAIDGFSTSGTPGLGLGSLRRLATVTDLYSHIGDGTVVFVAYVPPRAPERRPAIDTTALESAAFSIAAPPEPTSGDVVATHHMNGRTVFIVCDGLGHGLAAHEASMAVLEGCRDRLGHGLGDMIEGAHRSARHTRGAAVLVVELDHERGVVTHCGVGNVAGRIVGGQRSAHLVSMPGTVGAEAPRIHEFSHRWEMGSTLVMHSDGLQSRWSLDKYPGWRQRRPMLLAGLLYRDFQRGRDDVAVLVARDRVTPGMS
jgi:anti-sigma regulatory factor (Ser/Thr protein kinase)